ncbi:MAG TPA: tol-pal system protein YbgF [Burkholderiaceae bacterium]|nr:tol-pal system protein YbgF [Burkholderiaceae bacterium]
MRDIFPNRWQAGTFTKGARWSALLAPVVALAATLGAAGSAQAALFGDDEARKAILDLRQQVSDLATKDQQQISDLGKRLDRLEAGQSGQLELASQIDALRQDIAKLRGQVEQLTNDVATLQRRDKDLYTDLDARLKKLEPQSVTVDGRATQIDRGEQSAYDTALSQFRASDFRTAVTSLQNFVARYPDSPFAPSAQYWLGSSYYALKDYKSAITAQQVVVDRYGDSPRAPEALLNIAASQVELNDRAKARVTLNRIVKDFPDSDASKLAKERLASLGR